MGIKLWNLHTIPWCLRLLGNHISCLHLQQPAERPPPPPPPPHETIKLMNSDGLVKIYDRPVHVSDLMTEFPNHMVCRSDSFYIGQKIAALSGDDQLQLGHKYFLLPTHFFQSVLSFVTIASMADASSSSSSSSRELRKALLKKVATCQPFQIQKNFSSGCLRIRVSDEFIWQVIEEGRLMKENSDSRICSSPLLQKQYEQLVGSSRLCHWRPKLETIKETREIQKRKISSSSFGMKRKNKKSHQFIKTQNHVHLTCAKPKAPSNSKPKIKFKSSSRK